MATMRPAWGNPGDLQARSIGEKAEDLFIADFASRFDMERVLDGSPWMVGKHAVITKGFNGNLRASKIFF